MQLPPPAATNHPVDVGLRAEAAVLAELTRRGYRVLVPFGQNQRYDLVLDVGGGFIRVQCKTGRLRNGCVHFGTQSSRSNRRETQWRGYRGEVELFLVHCPDNGGLYAVPIEDLPRTAARLRIQSAANGQSSGIRWAADYEVPPA